MALDVYEDIYGLVHSRVASTLVGLARAHGSLGDFSTKLKLLERALHVSLQVFGEEHPEVAMVRANLARTMQKVGGSQPKAIALMRQAYEVLRKQWGEDDSDVLAMSEALADLKQSSSAEQGSGADSTASTGPPTVGAGLCGRGGSRSCSSSSRNSRMSESPASEHTLEGSC
mmetsp:Transcript_43017/g.113335  ORF Transcript_43017/g.113335 Transcript_43017/m.113335 type:complete len:172 (-) Transcript_43017:50-565(-)